MLRTFILVLFVTGFVLTKNPESSKDAKKDRALDYYDNVDTYDDDYDDDVDNENTSTPLNVTTIAFVKNLTNETRDSGQTIKFQCDVRNLMKNVTTKIKIEWYKNEVLLKADKKKINIRLSVDDKQNVFSSKLVVKKLEVHDKGFYTCRASNGLQKISTTAVVFVNPELTVPGETTAVDLPTYQPAFSESEEKSSSSNMPTTLPSPPRSTYDLTSLMPKTTNEMPYLSSPICQIYTGKLCEKYLKNLHVFIQPPFTQQQLEAKLSEAFVVVKHSKDISRNCESYAIPSLCYSVFPICIDPTLTNTKYTKDVTGRFRRELHDNVTKYRRGKIKNVQIPVKNVTDQHGVTEEIKLKRNIDVGTYEELNKRSTNILTTIAPLSINLTNIRNEVPLKRVCVSECEILENELCRAEYAIAKRHPSIGQAFTLDECSNLPKFDMETPDKCVSLGIQVINLGAEADACFWGLGQDYRGVAEKSKTGRDCMKWAHQLHFPLAEYPELSGQHAYCRNPGKVETEPWCYVGLNEREVCGVSKCATRILIYIVTSLSLAFIIITSVCFFICCRKNGKTPPRDLNNLPIPAADKNIYGNSRMSSPSNQPTSQPDHLQPFLREGKRERDQPAEPIPVFSMKDLTFSQELGEGAFGKVYKGELKAKKGVKIFVAVKTLKENASVKTQADFKREIDLISELRHANIVCLVGIVSAKGTGPVCMLFEFMEKGDLHEFLMRNSPSEGKSLSPDDFLSIAIQIACGMEYLSAHHYVHRDLAARNCLVGRDMSVKISDFGLSRDIYSSDYYRVQSKSLLPVRWMPPESILYGKFTTESDIWSFGVVLWEIYSYGLQPYYGYNNQEVINMIRSRQLLACPDQCPSYCYALMVECWCESPMRRPNFSEISYRLRMWKQNGNAIIPAQGNSFLKPSSSGSCTNSKTNTLQKGPPHGMKMESQQNSPSIAFNKQSRINSASLNSFENLHESMSSDGGARSAKSNVSSFGASRGTQSTSLSTPDAPGAFDKPFNAPLNPPSMSSANAPVAVRNAVNLRRVDHESALAMQPLLSAAIKQPQPPFLLKNNQFEPRNMLVQSRDNSYETKLTH